MLMENIQISPNHKETIYCWSFAKKLSYSQRCKYINKIQQNFNLEQNFTRDSYKVFLQKYFKIVELDIDSIDIFDESKNNIILIPFIHIEQIYYFLLNVKREILDFAKSKKLKIIVCYIRENMSDSEQEKIDFLFKQSCEHNEFLKNNLKILVNGFEPLKKTNYPNIFINIDSFPYYLRSMKIDEEQYNFFDNRFYDFSLMFGTFYERLERLIFLKELINKKIIDEKFFYSVICLDKDKTKNFVIENKNNICDDNFIENIDDYLIHKVYDKNGSILKPEQHIYNDNIEWYIPKQIQSSCVNIVLESRIEVPSITEKLYKPIICGIPFVWLGCKNIKNYLESKGYKMYPFINYSFDLENTMEGKIKLLIEEIQRLKSLGSEKLLQNVIECKDISIHNRNMFLKNTDNFDEFLLKTK